MSSQSIDAAASRRSMRRGTAMAVCATIVAALCTAAARAQTHMGQYEQADIEYGARLYAGPCTVCHGERGDQMPGINFSAGTFKNATIDRELLEIIRDGVPGTAMPPSGLSDTEISAVIAYLRNMGRVDTGGAAVGDAARGQALFYGKGDCGSCHRVVAQGPRVAPDLSSIGTMRTAATLHRTLLDPDAALLPINRSVRAVTRDGRTIVGRRLNEDTHTVQLVDERGLLVSLEKSELREYSLDDDARMPSYADVLDDAERADLVAYLLSLKGLR
jgi:putative heme-binding domain-containing protein